MASTGIAPVPAPAAPAAATTTTETPAAEERLPLVPEEVTPAWLGSKLGQPVRSATLTRAVYGTGSKLLFALEYADESSEKPRPSHVCVKGVFDPQFVAAEPWTVSLAQREADFFARIAPSIRHMGYPTGWWGGTDARQGIAIMSDLTCEGCTFPPDFADYPLEAVLEGAAQIAGLHAQFWGQSEADHPWIWNNYDPAMKFIVEPWDSVVREPWRMKLPDYLYDGARVKAAQDKYYAKRNPRFRTLLHGDTHLGNTYFTAEGKTRFLDWSAYHFGSCFHDLVYFLSSMLSVADRRAHEMAVLDHYLETLHRLGGPKLDRHNDEELMVEYKRSYLTNIIWPVCGTKLQTKERINAFTERTIAAWEDHQVIAVIEAQ